MKLIKSRFNSLLNRKYVYSITYEDERELGQNILYLLDRFSKKYMYIEIFKKDQYVLQFFEDINIKKAINMKNFILIENPKKEIIEKFFDEKNINSLRFISIYLFDKPITTGKLNDIKVILNSSAFYFSCDNYLEHIILRINPDYYESSLIESVLNKYR